MVNFSLKKRTYVVEVTSQFEVIDVYRTLELQCQRHQSHRHTSICSQCSDLAMIVFCWRCIQQN